MASAPRLWESLYLKLMARIDQAPALAPDSSFHAARFSTCRVKRAERFFDGQELDLPGRSWPEEFRRGTKHPGRNGSPLSCPQRALDKIVLSKLREAVGCGDFRFYHLRRRCASAACG